MQTGAHDLPQDSSWEEVKGLLQQAKSLDVLSLDVRKEAFVALDRYHAFHQESNLDVDRWRTRVAMKREEMDHLDNWLSRHDTRRVTNAFVVSERRPSSESGLTRGGRSVQVMDLTEIVTN